MRPLTRSRQFKLVAVALATGAMLAEPASAQLLFDWGGQEKPNDSGRIIGRFDDAAKPGEIIVSFGDRRLYLVTAPGQAVSYPIAIPREQDRWQGKTTVTQKRENPSWTPTPTMIKENPKLPRWVPGGHPMNPLGVRALYLGSSFYRIHGTDAPWTIGTAVSKGCIRMYNKDAQDVYEKVKVGARVLVTWNTYKFTPNPDQPQLPQQREEQPSAAGAQVSAAESADGQATAQPVRYTPSEFQNPFVSDGPPVPRPRVRAEPAAAPAVEPERETQPARSKRARDAAKSKDGESGSEKSRRSPASPVETGSIGERRPSASSKAKVEVSKQKAAPRTGEEPASPQEQAAIPAAVAAPVAVPVTVPVSPPPQADASAEIAARAMAAAERAAAAAERAAAAAERAASAAPARPAVAESAAPVAASEVKAD